MFKNFWENDADIDASGDMFKTVDFDHTFDNFDGTEEGIIFEKNTVESNNDIQNHNNNFDASGQEDIDVTQGMVSEDSEFDQILYNVKNVEVYETDNSAPSVETKHTDEEVKFVAESEIKHSVSTAGLNLYRKCLCQEVTECLLETSKSLTCSFKDGTLTVSIPNDYTELFSKCSLKIFKDFCSYGKIQETKYISGKLFQDDIHFAEYETQQTYSVDPIAAKLCLRQEMLKCFQRKICYLDDANRLLEQSLIFCNEKIEKLSILNAFKLAKADVIVLKKEYFEAFDEEFEVTSEITEAKKESDYGYFDFSQWFYNFHKRLCHTFLVQ
uniref:Uncharacterized protein n=1 Tax=Panagrolaimus superbus TaxID=310955 RepID=A0A914Y376_9BILA